METVITLVVYGLLGWKIIHLVASEIKRREQEEQNREEQHDLFI